MENDWKWQLNHAITEENTLKAMLPLSQYESTALKDRPFKLTPYMASLIAKESSGVLRKQFLPQHLNMDKKFCGDYLSESKYEVVPNLIHKYENRVAMIVNHQCACYCQFCTRQRIVRDGTMSHCNLEQAITYVHNNTSIFDVLLTGGDPFVLESSELDAILKDIYSIAHVKIVRIGTRVPITLPMRVDAHLYKCLRKLLSTIH